MAFRCRLAPVTACPGSKIYSENVGRITLVKRFAPAEPWCTPVSPGTLPSRSSPILSEQNRSSATLRAGSVALRTHFAPTRLQIRVTPGRQGKPPGTRAPPPRNSRPKFLYPQRARACPQRARCLVVTGAGVSPAPRVSIVKG